MKNLSFKSFIPYIAAIIIFILLSMAYLSPLLEGKKLRQDDISRHKGMSKEVMDFREATGEEALWTNSMFSGMPAYQISVKYKGNLIQYIDDIIRLGLPLKLIIPAPRLFRMLPLACPAVIVKPSMMVVSVTFALEITW